MTPDYWSRDADILMRWDDGRVAQLGTLHFETVNNEPKKIRIPYTMRFRIGWELVKVGFTTIFRKADTTHD